MRPPLASWEFSCGDAEQTLVLLLLPAQPVIGGDALRAPRGGLEPSVHSSAQLLVLAHALGEGHVREAAVEAGEQLPQRAQPLELLGAELAVAGPGPRWMNQTDALQIAQHARRPACGLRSLVDRQPIHAGVQP